ncbi:MAG TPA: hypothetical protein VMY35_02710 [Phycisphaerae bacterium]|nr:hypothetical protein [Phycisphaerae bacterium]
MATAGDQINGALRLIGMLAEGETPSAETSQDALAAMNQMIDSWNTERLSVYATQDQVFTWPATEATRTIGPTGDFVGNRPIQLLDSTYFRDSDRGLSFNLQFINQNQYNGIAFKTATSTYPRVIFVNDTFPDMTMTVYPVPNKTLEFHLVSVTTLTQPALLNTELSFPPGYLRAFRFNLATELAAEFGVEPSPQVSRIAMTSKRNLKRINNPNDVMSMPAPLVTRNWRFNIYAGAY